jgi:hypothetical protein
LRALGDDDDDGDGGDDDDDDDDDYDDDDDDDDNDDEYKPVFPGGRCAISQGGETSKAYNRTQPFHICNPFR